ncbi:NACHT domain-containing protein [Leifsonia shinshuensis]|uniref:NACHT domain-containing protein n=1 Tax=Leifsonia shinshuensis TaxID=150026 RepID=UPI001F51084E|nr:NACHT domain-containing protein [Leifsonia shinshuensis]MCI0156807.1 NACHT domain-containing protein [Leifsonia shinshuensis]
MARSDDQQEEQLFEEEVLRVSRALFAKDRPYQGATYLDASERDGIFIGDDVVVVVEATVSRRLEKAQKDGDKLKQACERLAKEHRFKGVKGYFVTRDEPTADQRRYIEQIDANVVACSLTQLRSKLIDANEYLTVREMYAFGSARNPASGSMTDLDTYVPFSLSHLTETSERSFSTKELADRTLEGGLTVLTGDFGAGKSMTLREVHRILAAGTLKKRTLKFPLTLNLRDHQAQTEPDEAIRRHASRVGFGSGTQLVRAWRAGEVSLLLDGFDEIATTGWLGQATELRDIRRRSVELVRKFVEQSPAGCGILLTGRRHFFDSASEMRQSLGIAARDPLMLTADQFTNQQVSTYLERHGWTGALPNWLPARPLLLGYLATSGAIKQLAESTTDVGPAEGWDLLLERLCAREATMEFGVDGPTIRRILERLATVARGKPDGTGPLFKEDLALAFYQVCNYNPDEGSYQLLERLPGLGVLDETDGSRHLIDPSLASAAGAGDVVRFVIAHGADESLGDLRRTAVPLNQLGISVSEFIARRTDISGSHVLAVAKRIAGAASDALVLDMARLALELGETGEWPALTFSELYLESIVVADVDEDLQSLNFVDCVVATLDLTEYDGDRSLPVFRRCAFGVVKGAGSLASLPTGHFQDCGFDQFDPASKTTRGILASPGLSSRQRVILTILKKVYMQAGSGRKDSALTRGLDDKLRALVPLAVESLINADLIVTGRAGGNTIYYPVRGATGRVRQMLESGSSSSDQVMADAR